MRSMELAARPLGAGGKLQLAGLVVSAAPAASLALHEDSSAHSRPALASCQMLVAGPSGGWSHPFDLVLGWQLLPGFAAASSRWRRAGPLQPCHATGCTMAWPRPSMNARIVGWVVAPSSGANALPSKRHWVAGTPRQLLLQHGGRAANTGVKRLLHCFGGLPHCPRQCSWRCSLKLSHQHRVRCCGCSRSLPHWSLPLPWPCPRFRQARSFQARKALVAGAGRGWKPPCRQQTRNHPHQATLEIQQASRLFAGDQGQSIGTTTRCCQDC